jgi:rSAM/selenodomain-associated transferase 2
VISIIVPVLNEAAALPATLAALAAEIRVHRDVEVVAVDGGSSDGTREILARSPGIRVLAAPRGRASQLNAGAAAARGDVLLFLHADTLLPPGALAAIAAAARRRSFAYGGFHHRWSGRAPSLRFISLLHNIRCRITSIFYGDQAFFVSRAAFVAVGGFPECLVEDIAICERLRRRARPAFLPLAVVTSSRKFERMGVWRSFIRVLAVLLCLRIGREPPRAFFADIR